MHLNTSDNMAYSESSDEELVLAYQREGDQHALAYLMQRYAGYVIAFGGPRLREQGSVEDFAQDLFLKLAERLKGTEVHNFKAWLGRVMRNMFLDGQRRSSLHQRVVEQILPRDAGYRIEEQIEWEFLRPKLEAALGRLSEEEERAVRGVYLEEKSYQELMAETGWSFNQLRGYRQRGMQKLRTDLKTLWIGT